LDRLEVPRGKKIFGSDAAKPLIDRESFGRRPDQQHVIGLLHHAAGDRDRIAGGTNAGDGTGPQIAAIHDRGIQFEGPLDRHHRPPSGVEQRIVLEHANRFLDGIQRRASFAQDRRASRQRTP